MTNTEARKMTYDECKVKCVACEGDCENVLIGECRKRLEALEQEPCEDCVSKQAVIELAEWFDLNPQHFSVANLIDEVENIPSVNPQEPKTGRWIYDDDVLSYEGHFGAYTCSCCNKTFLDDLCMNNGSDEINVGNEFKYCPFCGAKMESEEN